MRYKEYSREERFLLAEFKTDKADSGFASIKSFNAFDLFLIFSAKGNG